MKLCLLLVVAALTAACSTTPTPGVCCIGPDDCGRLGLSEDRRCPAGQTCADFHCVVGSCSVLGCPAGAPVCDLTTDGGTCRGCRLDTECASGACADDGACVDEASIVYLYPTGADVGTCRRDAPCRRLDFGATKTSDVRNHIVMAPGQYDLDGEPVEITAQNTPAPRLFIHGGGGVISTTGELAVHIGARSTVRDLEIIGNGRGLSLDSIEQSVLERVKIRGSNATYGIAVSRDALMRDITIEGGGTAIHLVSGARLTLDRGVIKNPTIGVGSFGSGGATVVDISNLLVFGATEVAFDLTMSAGGTVSFTTIADSGTDSGSGPRAFRCSPSNNLTIRSSIIWAPGSVLRPAIDTGCTLVSTIVGPTTVHGAANVDPRFEDAPNQNYRLSASSPARDAVDSGPATDFEGDPRPRGARFDIGADERP